MRIPRDLSGADLVKMLAKLGYATTRQAGSHIRLTTQLDGEHHITIPNHDPLRMGTLSAILNSIASHHGITREEILARLFE